MAVIALVGNKGGAGKTTLCVNLAAALNRRAPAVVLDTDPQQSSLGWRSLAESGDAVEVDGAVDAVGQAAKAARRKFEHVVIDCPPSVHSEQTRQALAVADIALVPVQPSPFDLWASVHIETEVEQARKRNKALRAWLVINQLEPRTRLSRQMRDALAELELPAAKTGIHRRMVYRSAVLAGRTVHDMGRAGEAAAAEIDALIDEVLKP